jgi:hypothetical protein
LIRGSQVTPNILDRSEILIRRYYNEKGYDNAEIRVQQQEEVDQDGLVYVDIFIDKKERVKVNSIVLQGNSAVDDKMLKKVMVHYSNKVLLFALSFFALSLNPVNARFIKLMSAVCSTCRVNHKKSVIAADVCCI